MWIFCQSGFFSAVQHYDNADIIHVRARFAGDIERLCTAHAVSPQVTHTPGNDYPYRMDFSRTLWAKIVQAEAEAIDYDNFKDSVHGERARDVAYMSCWSALRRAQN